MKILGKIKDYDGMTGNIVASDGKCYLLVNSEIIGDNVKSGDVVSFDGDIYSNDEITKYIARFVKKVDSNMFEKEK